LGLQGVTAGKDVVERPARFKTLVVFPCGDVTQHRLIEDRSTLPHRPHDPLTDLVSDE
jgi:hypothetical protein